MRLLILYACVLRLMESCLDLALMCGVSVSARTG